MSTFKVTPNILLKKSNTWVLNHPFAQSGGALFAIIADWCGHCKRLHESVSQTQKQYNTKFKFFYLDGGNNDDPHVQKLLQVMQVSSFPTLFTVQKGGILTPYKGSREPFELFKNFQ